MKKLLLSKVALALMLVSVSTQIMAGPSWAAASNEWFKRHPIVKGALVTAAALTPAILVTAGLCLYDYANLAARIEQDPNMYVMVEKLRMMASIVSNQRFMSAEEILMHKCVQNLGIGIASGVVSGILANEYLTEYLVFTGIFGASIASLFYRR